MDTNDNTQYAPLDNPNLSREESVKRSAASWKRLVEEMGVDPLTAYLSMTMTSDEYWKHAMILSELKSIGGVDVMNFDYSNHKLVNAAQAKFRDIQYEMDDTDKTEIDMSNFVAYQHKDGSISLVPKDQPLPFTVNDLKTKETPENTDTEKLKTLAEWMMEEELTDETEEPTEEQVDSEEVTTEEPETTTEESVEEETQASEEEVNETEVEDVEPEVDPRLNDPEYDDIDCSDSCWTAEELEELERFYKGDEKEEEDDGTGINDFERFLNDPEYAKQCSRAVPVPDHDSDDDDDDDDTDFDDYDPEEYADANDWSDLDYSDYGEPVTEAEKLGMPEKEWRIMNDPVFGEMYRSMGKFEQWGFPADSEEEDDETKEEPEVEEVKDEEEIPDYKQMAYDRFEKIISLIPENIEHYPFIGHQNDEPWINNIIPGDKVTFGDIRMAIEHHNGINVFAPQHIPAYTKARAMFNGLRDRFLAHEDEIIPEDDPSGMSDGESTFGEILWNMEDWVIEEEEEMRREWFESANPTIMVKDPDLMQEIWDQEKEEQRQMREASRKKKKEEEIQEQEVLDEQDAVLYAYNQNGWQDPRLKEFQSVVWDYGEDDDYHGEDEVLEDLAPGEEESLERKEKRLRLAAQELKHRYRRIESWIEATEIYREYVYFLFEKYGGKKRFKFARAIGLSKEWFPYFPVLKKNKETKAYIESGEEYQPDLHVPEGMENDMILYPRSGIPVRFHFADNPETNHFKFPKQKKRATCSVEVVDRFEPYLEYAILEQSGLDLDAKNDPIRTANSILDDLDYLADFTAERNRDMNNIDRMLSDTHLSMKKRKKLLKKRGKIMSSVPDIKRKNRNGYVGLHERFKQYYKEKFRNPWVDDEERYRDPNQLIIYKDVWLKPERYEQLQLIDRFTELGIIDFFNPKKILPKKARRVKVMTSHGSKDDPDRYSTKKEKKKAKKKKKKKDKERKKFMKDTGMDPNNLSFTDVTSIINNMANSALRK